MLFRSVELASEFAQVERDRMRRKLLRRQQPETAPVYLSQPAFPGTLPRRGRGWQVAEGLSAFEMPAGDTTRTAYEAMRDEILAHAPSSNSAPHDNEIARDRGFAPPQSWSAHEDDDDEDCVLVDRSQYMAPASDSGPRSPERCLLSSGSAAPQAQVAPSQLSGALPPGAPHPQRPSGLDVNVCNKAWSTPVKDHMLSLLLEGHDTFFK